VHVLDVGLGDFRLALVHLAERVGDGRVFVGAGDGDGQVGNGVDLGLGRVHWGLTLLRPSGATAKKTRTALT
jgi:hypothetical protein